MDHTSESHSKQVMFTLIATCENGEIRLHKPLPTELEGHAWLMP